MKLENNRWNQGCKHRGELLITILAILDLHGTGMITGITKICNSKTKQLLKLKNKAYVQRIFFQETCLKLSLFNNLYPLFYC